MLSGGRKRQRSKSVRTQELAGAVRADIEQKKDSFINTLAAKFEVGRRKMQNLVHEDLKLKSYKHTVRHTLTPANTAVRLARAKKLRDALRLESAGMLIFFSDEKIFSVSQKLNHQNDRWLASETSEVPVVQRTKYPASCHVLGVISNEGDVMPPHFFEPGERINPQVYLHVLRTVVKPWMEAVSAGRPYIFQQDGAPAHRSDVVQIWLQENVHSFWRRDLWPPYSPDLNPLDYHFWAVAEKMSNSRAHSNVETLKTAISAAFSNIATNECRRACASLRARVDKVIAANGSWIE